MQHPHIHNTPEKPEYLRRNYLLVVIEGGFFMGSLQFLSMEAVMPSMLHEMGGPGWAVSFSSSLFILGFTWPQILSAIWVERMRRMKPLIMTLGVIQRLPYLLTGLFLIFYGREYPTTALYVALATPFLMSSVGGLQGSAYFELISRMIPIRRNASMWALRNLMMAVFGICAGLIIRELLDAYPGSTGYGVLHLITFCMMIVSIIMFSRVRETNIPDIVKQDPVCFRSGFAVFFKQWRENPSLGRFVITRMLFILIFILIPFLSVRAIDKTGQPASLVGIMVTAQMIGYIAGNLLSGYLGDRFGVKKPMLLGRILMITGILAATFSVQVWQFLYIFFCLGFGLSTAQVGDLTMVFDFAPAYRRKFFFAVMALLIVPGVLSAIIISAVLQYVSNGFTIACAISGVGCAASLFYLLRLRDPRLHNHSGDLLEQFRQTAD